MSKRSKKRLKCPKCGSKGIHLLNKKQNIWECKRESCNHKFMYIAQSNTYLALGDKDVQIVEAAPTDKSPVKETNEIVEAKETVPTLETIVVEEKEEEKDSLLKMAEDLGF